MSLPDFIAKVFAVAAILGLIWAISCTIRAYLAGEIELGD